MKPKILFILHAPPPVHGAAMVGKYIKDSSRINDAFDTRYINLGTSRTVDDIGKGGFLKMARFIGLLWKVMVQMVMFRPQKVYLTLTAKGNGFYKDAGVVLLAKILGGNMIYHFHNKGVRTRQEAWFDNWLYQRVFEGAAVILLSPHLYCDVEKYVPEKRVHYCPNGIPEMEGGSKQTMQGIEGKVQLLFLSNLIASKGVFILLEACKLLKERGLNFYCTFVGGEGDVTVKEFEEKVTALSVESVVAYGGKKYGEEKKRVFSASDIFVFPTYYETFGLVNLEAMQASLPVVSTPEGGIPDVVEDGITGFLVSQRNVNAIAEKLELLIKKPELRKRMGIAGKKRYEEHFTIQQFEQRMTDILHKVTV